MIEPIEIVQRLRDAAFSIGPAWDEHLDNWAGEPAGSYTDVSVIARHLVSLVRRNEVVEVEAIFSAIEELLHSDISVDARKVLIVGLLEDVQTICSHAEVGVRSSSFAPFLGPATLLAWIELHGYWGTDDT